MVRGELCVSCFNREAEWRRGRNARGTRPVTYVPIRAHLVGVIGPDGRPVWGLFEGQHQPEAMARACRAGEVLTMHQPGDPVWNPGRQAFEYRDAEGRVLLALIDGDRLTYIAVDRLHPGEQPAPVTMPTILLPPEAAPEVLAAMGVEVGPDWHQTDFGCQGCRRGMLHACRAAGEIQVRCSAGCC